MTEAAAIFWQRYVGTLPAEHPHRQAQPDAFTFGDSPALADELGALVQAGRKRATASLPVEFTSVGLPLPAAGDVSIVLLADGAPVAIIELVEVRHVPFQAVDAAFAADEGEDFLRRAVGIERVRFAHDEPGTRAAQRFMRGGCRHVRDVDGARIKTRGH